MTNPLMPNPLATLLSPAPARSDAAPLPTGDGAAFTDTLAALTPVADASAAVMLPSQAPAPISVSALPLAASPRPTLAGSGKLMPPIVAALSIGEAVPPPMIEPSPVPDTIARRPEIPVLPIAEPVRAKTAPGADRPPARRQPAPERETMPDAEALPISAPIESDTRLLPRLWIGADPRQKLSNDAPMPPAHAAPGDRSTAVSAQALEPAEMPRIPAIDDTGNARVATAPAEPAALPAPVITPSVRTTSVSAEPQNPAKSLAAQPRIAATIEAANAPVAAASAVPPLAQTPVWLVPETAPDTPLDGQDDEPHAEPLASSRTMPPIPVSESNRVRISPDAANAPAGATGVEAGIAGTADVAATRTALPAMATSAPAIPVATATATSNEPTPTSGPARSLSETQDARTRGAEPAAPVAATDHPGKRFRASVPTPVAMPPIEAGDIADEWISDAPIAPDETQRRHATAPIIDTPLAGAREPKGESAAIPVETAVDNAIVTAPIPIAPPPSSKPIGVAMTVETRVTGRLATAASNRAMPAIALDPPPVPIAPDSYPRPEMAIAPDREAALIVPLADHAIASVVPATTVPLAPMLATALPLPAGIAMPAAATVSEPGVIREPMRLPDETDTATAPQASVAAAASMQPPTATPSTATPPIAMVVAAPTPMPALPAAVDQPAPAAPIIVPASAPAWTSPIMRHAIDESVVPAPPGRVPMATTQALRARVNVAFPASVAMTAPAVAKTSGVDAAPVLDLVSAMPAPPTERILAAEAPAASAPVATGDPAWIRDMIERIETLRDTPGTRETRIRLTPDALGAIEVTIRETADGVQVQLAAETPAARALLAEAAPRLAEMAEARGLKLGQPDAGAGHSGDQRPQPEPQRAQTNRTTGGRLAADTQTDERIA